MERSELKVGDRVVMIKDGYIAKEGDRGTLIRDDGSLCPKFEWDKGSMESYELLKNMKPLTLDDAKPSEWDKAYKASKKHDTLYNTMTSKSGQIAWIEESASIPPEELDRAVKRLAALGDRQTSTVEAPAHYNEGGIECIDYIRQQLGKEGFIAYCEGNVIKYHHRYKYKGGVEDLKKARKYQEWMMEALEAKEAVELETMMGRNR
jgi:hypothetical protein